MGIYDRDYYREGPSYLESLIPSGLVCKWLIAINVLVFIAQLVTETRGDVSWITEALWLDPQAVLSGQVWRLLSYAFLHGGFWHIFFNMLFLWFFGSDLEVLYGRREFIAFYLISALLGGLFYEGWALAGGYHAPCLGASGAVTALLVLCACHFPNRVIYLMFMIPVPLWLLAVFNVAQDSFRLFSGTGGPVAVVVHLAGAGFAYAYYRFQFRLTDTFSGWVGRFKRPRTRPRLRLFRPEDADAREEPVSVAAVVPESPGVDEHLEAKLDAVLEKLARAGKESLTDTERQILMRASEIYKRRRT
jgi:membrane associated rhomboid family serine protease